MIQSRLLFRSILDPLHIQHSVLVLFPCCTARARVTKLFLHTGHCVSATKRIASPRLPCPDMCVRNAASDSKIVSQTSHLCSVDAAATTSPKLYASTRSIHHSLPRLGKPDPQFIPWPRVCIELLEIGQLPSSLGGHANPQRSVPSMTSSFLPHSAEEH